MALKKNTIKNSESNFQHLFAHARGHSRSCSLNGNEPGDAIETQDTVSLAVIEKIVIFCRYFLLFSPSRS